MAVPLEVKQKPLPFHGSSVANGTGSTEPLSSTWSTSRVTPSPVATVRVETRVGNLKPSRTKKLPFSTTRFADSGVSEGSKLQKARSIDPLASVV